MVEQLNIGRYCIVLLNIIRLDENIDDGYIDGIEIKVLVRKYIVM